MRNLRNRFFVGLLILTPVAAVFADAVTLVQDGRAACTIVTGRDDGMSRVYTMLYADITNVLPSNVLREAAADLALHLNEMGGIWNPAHQVKVVDEAAQARTQYRVLLGTAATEEHGLADEAAKIPYPGYVYRVAGNDLLIFGSSSKGTANGIYGFLQDELGVRWFGPQELFKVVPREETVQVGPLDKQVEPSFLGRLVHVEARIEHPAYYWARRRMRMTESLDEGEPFRNSSHNIPRIFPTNRYFETNPEYYAVRSGTRRPDRPVIICYANPQVVEIAANAALAHFRRNPMHHSFALGIDDGTAYCECPECAKLQPERYFRGSRVASDMYFHFVNEVARRVKDEFPERRLGVIAYNDVTVPPLGEVEDNVFVVLVNDISEYFDASYRAQDEELVAAWEKKGITMGLYYYTQLAKLVPAHFPRLLAQELKDKHARGYKSVTTESGNGWPWHGPMAYVEMRLLWDVGLDVDELLDEYFRELYGPAAGHLRAMYELFEQIHMRPRSGGFLNEHYKFRQFRPYTQDDLEKIKKLLASAHKAIEGLGTGYGGQERLEEQRLAYVSNGLRLFLEMLEGYTLAQQLEALPESMDNLDAMRIIGVISRVQDIIERHEAVYREAIVQDEYLPRRFRGDTATPVRNQWKNRLSAAVGDALVKLNEVAAGTVAVLDSRVAEKMKTIVQRYTADEFMAGLFRYRTGELSAGENLVLNPGFEVDGDQVDFPVHLEWEASPAYGWAYWQYVPGKGTFDVAADVSRSGARAGRMTGIGRGGYCTVVRDVEEGALYHLLAHVKNTAHVTREAKPYVRSEVYWLDEEDRWHQRGLWGAPETRELDRWVELEQVVKVPAGAAAAVIWIFGQNLQDGEQIFVDDVIFRQLR